MNKEVVIVSGGKIEDAFVQSVLKNGADYFIIGVDKGIEALYRFQIEPDYIVGDFDSVDATVADYYRNETHIPIREFNPVKDASDTEIAIRLAITLGGHKITILGATGGRLDHFWGNVQSLMIPYEAGVEAVIVDSQNRIRLLHEGETVLKREEMFGKYFSLFPLGREVNNLTIAGAKYTLNGYTMTPTITRCVSNQIAKDSDEVHICFTSGVTILMETKDKE